jgi:hypothetical protein
MLDLRLPSGLFFAITGVLLMVFGIVSHVRAPMSDANVDLYVGGVMTAFGLILLLLARRAARHRAGNYP